MLELTRLIDTGAPTTTLTLPWDRRIRSRQRVVLDDGSEAGLFLDRGRVLHQGDRLTGEAGVVVEVRAAPEPVSEARTADPLLLARACYHLGNRHVPLQIGEGWVRYLHDHVLDDLLRGLGLEPTAAEMPFQPEPGAYGGSAQGHGHQHGHGHGHGDPAHVHVHDH